MQQQDIISALPTHLRCFVQVQDYGAYTPRDHAVWRFLMLQLPFQLAETAHPVSLEGLRRPGLSLERFPPLEDMNRCLSAIGSQVHGVHGPVAETRGTESDGRPGGVARHWSSTTGC